MNFPMLLLALLPAACAVAQGSRADYDRAASFADRMRDKVLRMNVQVHWLGDGRQFWYEVAVEGGRREYIVVDADQGEKRSLFDREKLAAALSAAGAETTASDLHVAKFWLSDDAATARFTALDKRWECELKDYAVREISDESDSDSSNVRTLEVLQPSRNGGQQTSIRFVNRRNEPLRLVWLDASGGRTPYGAVDVGEEHDQYTYSRHTWLVTDRRGRELAAFHAMDEPGVAVVDQQSRLRRGDDSESDRRRRQRSRTSESPDQRWRASIEDGNVVLENLETGEQVKLSDNGTADDPYIGRFEWSPDSKKLVAIQERAGQEREVHLIESSPRDRVQPKLHSFEYAKPGDKLPLPRPRLFDVSSRKQISIADDLAPNPWSISEIHWQPDSRRFTFLYNQRGHQVLRLIVVDADTGSTGVLVDECSETFIDYYSKQFLRQLDAAEEIIWTSERDGWNHLYLFDARTGDLKNQITRGEWVVRRVDRVDEDKRQIWFRAGGVYPEQDPYYVHYCRINFDGTGFTILTEGNGTHDVDFSPDREYIVDVWSRVDQPPITELRRADDGSLVCELERADWGPLLKAGWKAPERFVAKGRDGETDIFGVIYRPANFDRDKEYPVIEKIYAGPHGAFVPKEFSAVRDTQSLAELGFIVVQIDGMGTSQRSKEFHDVCWKNLGDAGFPDRIAWLKAAAKKYPQMDLSRVGVYGGSAGGQNAVRALLAHGDFYKVAVADCGCHDNRMDKISWNEQWMGWPIGPHYEEQSNVTQADKLQGKLLLIAGELDRNVDPASTMQVVDALIRADKDFDLLVIPGEGHGAGSSPYGTRRTRDFFVRQLHGVEPRSEP